MAMDKRKHRVLSGMISAVMVWVLLLGVLVPALPAQAAVSYEGRGTKSDPYIITTPEQLDGIRDNLSAHYKLGATIDMQQFGNFVSIGGIPNPFTGSLTCDTDAAGKPIYAIVNLKIHFDDPGANRAAGWTSYKEDGSMGWMVGLFGVAKGATFENILLLNADIFSNVQGLSQMNEDFSLNPGQDDQGTGTLVARAESVKISGCGVTGTLTSSSNGTGGLAGRVVGRSTVKNSYSFMTVNVTGTWGTGGFCASLGDESTIDSCAFSGFFNNTSKYYASGGAFVGSVSKTVEDKGRILITNCWAAGKVAQDDSGCFLGADSHNMNASLASSYTAGSKHLIILDGDGEVSTGIRGDVNGDGKVDETDIDLIRRYVAGEIAFTDSMILAGDVNGNTVTDLKDATAIWLLLEGKIESFDQLIAPPVPQPPEEPDPEPDPEPPSEPDNDNLGGDVDWGNEPWTPNF